MAKKKEGDVKSVRFALAPGLKIGKMFVGGEEIKIENGQFEVHSDHAEAMHDAGHLLIKEKEDEN